jgi:mRNA-degrading endonuclease RelE of RelBE toxin-antitoxin system
MNYNVLTIDPFDKQLKKLAKKYPSLKQEFIELVESLETDPIQGTPIGDNCFKIRLAIKSKGKGKSGGARIITNVVVTKSTVYLLTIYDKSEKENLTDKELTELLKFVDD